MTALDSARAPAPGGAPVLRFAIESCAAVAYAAVPTLSFALRLESEGGAPIRSVLLDVQIQIAARQRGYPPEVQGRLLELFGLPERWGATLRTLPWLRTTLVVPPFAGQTLVELPVSCSYDMEVTAVRYLAALQDGMVPLEFLFSGSVFFSTPEGLLQTSRIGWDQEAGYRMPVAVWREAMDRHFPDCAWLRLGRTSFSRLAAYKAAGAFMSWDDAVGALLAAAGEGP